ncbi:Conserved_hypothetical protein [Hexamita inflata]|uniref:PCI domain-containing protein n=1 Tax=Hexamita inflata TaxID=28002 RepID=A0ABP1GIY2_9EUKA
MSDQKPTKDDLKKKGIEKQMQKQGISKVDENIIEQEQQNQASLILRETIKANVAALEEIEQSLQNDASSIRNIIDQAGYVAKHYSLLGEHQPRALGAFRQIGITLANRFDVMNSQQYITTIKDRFQNNNPQTYQMLMASFFEAVIDLQTKVPHNFVIDTIPYNLYKIPTSQLAQNIKILAVIFYSGKLILEAAKAAKMYELSSKVIVQLLQTAVMFKRIEEAKVLVTIFNQIVIDEDEPVLRDQLEIKLLNAKIDVACCLISLEVYDEVRKQLIINSQQMKTICIPDHIDVCCKLFRLTNQYLPLLGGLINYLRVKGCNAESRTYYIEAMTILNSLDYFTIKSELEMLCNDQFTLDQETQNILLFGLMEPIVDLTNKQKKINGIRSQFEAFLMSNTSQLTAEFKEYIEKYLKGSDDSKLVVNGIKKLTEISKSRDHISFADIQIQKIIANQVIQILKKTSITIEDLFQNINGQLKEAMPNEDIMSLQKMKKIVLSLIQQGQIKVKIDYKSGLITPVEQQQANTAVKFNLEKLLAHNFHLNHEKDFYPSITQQEAQIAARKEELVEMSRKLYDLEQKRLEEEQERTKKNQDSKKKELLKIQNEERRIQFYKKNCNQYIDEIANSVGDDELAEYLEQIMDSTKAQFEQTKLPQPEQWRERLNNEANLYNRSRLEKRIQELQREMVKIEAKLYVSWNEFQREQMNTKQRENQIEMNRLLKLMSENRHKHNMEIYEKNQKALQQFSTLKNLEQLKNDQKAIDDAEHQKKLEVYNEKVQKRAAELQKKDEQEKSKQAEIEKAEKLAKFAKLKAMKQAAAVGVEQSKVVPKGTVTIEAPKEPQRPTFTNSALQRPVFTNSKMEEQKPAEAPAAPGVYQPKREAITLGTQQQQPKKFGQK